MERQSHNQSRAGRAGRMAIASRFRIDDVDLEGSPNGMAAVLKTAVLRDVGVQVPHPPQTSSAGIPSVVRTDLPDARSVVFPGKNI